MEELLSCSVCCEQYQEKHRHPVLLPRCGHSFCRPCIAFLVKNGCVICPSCRMDQRVETADHLPTEFSLLAITNAQRVTKMETCDRHDVKLSFWCRTCSTPACGECLFEEHPTHSHRIVKATTYVEEMKDAVKGIAAKFTDALDLRERWHHQQVFQAVKAISDAVRTLGVLRRDIDDARELVKGVHVVEGIGPTTALSEASKCLGLKWNLKGCQLDLTDASGRQQDRDEEKDDGEEKVKEVEKEEDEEGKVSEEKNEAGKTSPAEVPAEEVEKTDDEKKPDAREKEIDELEALTEEERKKRRKILRLKEKLAAASAAAEKKDVASKDKDKADLKHKTERRSAKEKGEKEAEAKKENDPESVKSLTTDKAPRQARKHDPASRESSTSPPRDAAPGKDGHVTSKPELEAEAESDVPRKARREGECDLNKAANASFLAKVEPLPKSKPDAVSALKKPRSNADRLSLKRSKTVTFMAQDEDTAADDAKDDHSENIRGLDLQGPKLCRGDDLDNKEKEERAGDEETPQQEERQERKKEKKEAKKKNTKEKLFEMEPEEKERIATELLQVPSLTLVVEGIGGRLAYVVWEPMGLHVYCHQYQELPYDLLLKSSVLLTLLPTKAPLVFLDVGTELRVLGRVYISLWGHLRRAMNFLHLCLGDRGPSFRDSMFLDVMNADCPGERIRGGDYECNNGRGGETLLDDLEAEEGYSMPMEAGMVTAGGPNRKEVDSQFFICTEDDYDRRFACPFGRVVSGLPIMKEAVWLVMTKEIYIRDCGVVVEMPRI